MDLGWAIREMETENSGQNLTSEGEKRDQVGAESGL